MHNFTISKYYRFAIYIFYFCVILLCVHFALLFISIFLIKDLVPLLAPQGAYLLVPPSMEVKQFNAGGISSDSFKLNQGNSVHVKPNPYFMGVSSFGFMASSDKHTVTFSICIRNILPGKNIINLSDENVFITAIYVSDSRFSYLNKKANKNIENTCSNPKAFSPINGILTLDMSRNIFKHLTMSGSLQLRDSFYPNTSNTPLSTPNIPVEMDLSFNIDSEVIHTFGTKGGDTYEW